MHSKTAESTNCLVHHNKHRLKARKPLFEAGTEVAKSKNHQTVPENGTLILEIRHILSHEEDFHIDVVSCVAEQYFFQLTSGRGFIFRLGMFGDHEI